ncbi:MAG TPA: hypothetical protein DEQ55_01095 [Pseudomonas sp.]|nr:hypothetical protein [Pseudomonas sp.]
MADIIDLRVEDSLQEYALKAERIPVIDATCGVFMEMDENRLIAEGFGAHVPKGYVYAAMAFSAGIEMLNMLSRRAKRKQLDSTQAR